MYLVANTKFREIDEADFEGLYTSGTVDRKNVKKPLDNPILYELLEDGRKRESPEPKGKSWAKYGDRTYYYSEKIVDHWYYYEMIFNSNRKRRL